MGEQLEAGRGVAKELRERELLSSAVAPVHAARLTASCGAPRPAASAARARAT
jgi:hypothetical protein